MIVAKGRKEGRRGRKESRALCLAMPSSRSCIVAPPIVKKRGGRARQSGGKYDMPPPPPHSSYIVIVMRAISSDSPSERPFFSPEPTRRDAMPRHYNWVTLKGAISRLPFLPCSFLPSPPNGARPDRAEIYYCPACMRARGAAPP